MHPSKASIVIRPRTAWESLDLGILLACRHRRLLMLSWALVTLPILALLSLILWDYPGAVMLLFWWLKPLYERLPLLILSRALFGARPSLKEALKAWPATLRSQLLPSLLWRRLSPSRSFTLPVQQLEGLKGAERARRIGVLGQADLNAARCLTLVGAHLEMVLYLGLIILLYTLVPRQLDLDWSELALSASEAQTLWLDHLLNLLYALVLIAWGPVYVACGFMLYLNRRTRLEAWDLEQVFRRLRQRLAGTATALLIGAGLLLTILPSPGWAATEEPPPDSTRLTHQPLNSQQARLGIEHLLDKPPFKNPETVSGWRFPETTDRDNRADPDDTALPGWLSRLLESMDIIARLLEILLWGLAIGLSGVLAWRLRHWTKLFVTPQTAKAERCATTPQHLFGLQVAAESLPDDIAASVQALWPNSPREALGLLYRALLSRLINDYRLPLSNADTEGRVLERIALIDNPELNAYSQELTRHWQNLAYGHHLPTADTQQRLCTGWQRLFGSGEQP